MLKENKERLMITRDHPLWGDAPWRRKFLPADTPDFTDLFAEPQRLLEVEVGCGRGTFLHQRAVLFPEHNFLGIETQVNRVKVSRAKMQKSQGVSVRILNADARLVFSRYLPDESVAVVHIYFPDPWPKKKHLRRRLLQVDFFKAIDRCLQKNGRVYFATDDKGYYFFIKQELESSELSWTITRETINKRICNPEFKTEFERKFEEEGRDLHYLEICK